MGIGQSLLNIRETVISGGNRVKNFVKKHPFALVVPFGATGFVIGQVLVSSKKQNTDTYNTGNNAIENNAVRIATFIKYGHNLAQVVKADDGGTIEIYTDNNGKIFGSINKDKNGYIRNLSVDNHKTGGYYSLNIGNNGIIESIYTVDKNKKSVCTPAQIKEFYANGGKGVRF